MSLHVRSPTDQSPKGPFQQVPESTASQRQASSNPASACHRRKVPGASTDPQEPPQGHREGAFKALLFLSVLPLSLRPLRFHDHRPLPLVVQSLLGRFKRRLSFILDTCVSQSRACFQSSLDASSACVCGSTPREGLLRSRGSRPGRSPCRERRGRTARLPRVGHRPLGRRSPALACACPSTCDPSYHAYRATWGAASEKSRSIPRAPTRSHGISDRLHETVATRGEAPSLDRNSRSNCCSWPMLRAQPFHRQLQPSRLRPPLQVLRQRHPQHAVECMPLNLLSVQW